MMAKKSNCQVYNYDNNQTAPFWTREGKTKTEHIYFATKTIKLRDTLYMKKQRVAAIAWMTEKHCPNCVARDNTRIKDPDSRVCTHVNVVDHEALCVSVV
jgi:hypothetical protein